MGFARLNASYKLTTGSNLSPSLRANGSRECAPDDRLREAIHRVSREVCICFVATLVAMTTVNIVARMERSEIRESRRQTPDCAALHPGYDADLPVDAERQTQDDR
jgi:hypothetical protein